MVSPTLEQTTFDVNNGWPPHDLSDIAAASDLVTLAHDAAERRRLVETARIDDIVPNPYNDVEMAVSSDPMAYIRYQASRHRLLKVHEEVGLAKAIEVGVFAAERLESAGADSQDTYYLEALAAKGKAAYEYMIGANLGLVMMYAYQELPKAKRLKIDDLVDAGLSGLEIAIQKFDYTLGYKFSTFATGGIVQAIRSALLAHDRTICLPKYILDDLYSVRKTDTERTADQQYAIAVDSFTSTVSIHTPVEGDLTMEGVIDAIAAELPPNTNAALDEFIDEGASGMSMYELQILKDYLHATGEGTFGTGNAFHIQGTSHQERADVMDYVRGKLSHPSNTILEQQLTEREPWRTDAACRGTNLHDAFMSRDDRRARGLRLGDIRKFCGQCPVVDACADFAIANKQHFGIWGGLSRAQRQQRAAA